MNTKPKPKVTITKRAIIARINRALQQQENPEMLRTARSERQAEELGDYFTVETGGFGEPKKAQSNGVGRVYVDLEKFGRELGVLQPWEQVSQTE